MCYIYITRNKSWKNRGYNRMNYAYLTVDLEEWYELDYLKDYRLKETGVEVVPRIIDFLDILDDLHIKATFFVVGTQVESNCDIIRELAARGHAIGCHGLDHVVLYEKENSEFSEEIRTAKKMLEASLGFEVTGYRASCFSMERDKLELVRSAGYKYDSSKILFSQHPLYRRLDINGYEKVDDLVYIQEDFIEYEASTLRLGRLNIPVLGGGYLRALPFWAIKRLVRRYEKQQQNLLMYVHPFELTNISLPFSAEVSFKNKLRASIGRRNNLRKLHKILTLLTNEGVQFRTLSEDRLEKIKTRSRQCGTF